MTDDLPLPASTDEGEFARLVDWARRGPRLPVEIARLAGHLARGGERLSWPPSTKTADLASTGGPASLSTLIAPFALVVRGCAVVKLAVPGRPAGAIDVLATVPGYSARLSPNGVRQVVARCGFAHFLSDERFAPMDGALYAYRRRNGAVAVPMLVAASLLAKKFAVGLRFVGLDIRVGSHGNFGQTRDEARSNARLFCSAAQVLGMEAAGFISSDDGPAQPWIGRGEALVALASAAGIRPVDDGASWLGGHIAQCCHMGGVTAGDLDCDSSRTVFGTTPAALKQALEAHLVAQGATMEALLARVEAIVDAPRVTLDAATAGVLSIDLGVIRDALVALQTDATPGVFTDPAGVELLVKPGRLVAAGEPVARIRCERGGSAAAHLLTVLQPAFRTAPATEPRAGAGRTTGGVGLGSERPQRSMEVVRA